MPVVPLAKLRLVYSRRESHRPSRGGVGRRLAVYGGALLVAALLWFGVPAFFAWKHVISSSGGLYFPKRVVIPVPAFTQGDPRWSLELLGSTYETLGQAGCAVTSAAMVLSAYGVDTDPERLNQYLIATSGYTDDGSLYWEKAAAIAPAGQVEKAYEDPPSYALIDQNLLAGNPVIVRLKLQNGRTHFVVIVGKEGWDYLIQDPARSSTFGVYPLRDLTGRIEALRFYRVVPPHPVEVVAAPAVSTPPTAPALIPPVAASPAGPILTPILSLTNSAPVPVAVPPTAPAQAVPSTANP